MAFCSNCGHQLADDAKFCANCGTSTKSKNTQNNTERKSFYDGELHKCPNCGELLSSFVLSCPACGYELRGVKSTNSVKSLAAKLEELEAKRPPRRMSNIFTNAVSGGQLSNIDEQKVTLIKSFSIPNTKEDILEFIILASSNIDMKVYGVNSEQYQTLNPAQREVSDAWLAKLEQAYQKAQLLFGGSQEFLNIQALYEQKMKAIRKKKIQLPLFIVGCIAGSMLIVVFVWLLVYLTGAI